VKSVVVLGKTNLATRICEWIEESDRFDLAAVVPTRPQPDWCADLAEWAQTRGVRAAESGRLSQLEQGEFNIGISCFYDKILSLSDIQRFDLCLNIHNSLLPRHRGVGPIEWSMRDGTGLQGVSVHQLMTGVDTGPIFGQASFTIWPHLDSHEIHQMCLDVGYVLLVSVLRNLEAIKPTDQDEKIATYHSRDETLRMLQALSERDEFRSAT